MLRQVPVDHEPDVGLVDTHPEGHGGRHDLDLVENERFLDLLPLLRRQPGMVGIRDDAVLPQVRRQLLGALARGAVDDPGLALVLRQKTLKLRMRVMLIHHPQPDVRPVEARQEAARPACSPSLSTMSSRVCGSAVAVRATSGTSGKRSRSCPSATYSGRKSCPHCEMQCASSTRQQRDAAPRPSRSRKPSLTARSGDTYSSSSSPAWNCGQHPPGLVTIQRRVVGGRAHPVGPQSVHLVLHQRDERRHHDAGAGPQHRRDLVAERLPAPAGHEHEGVVPTQERVDDQLLVRAEPLVAEDATQDMGGGISHPEARYLPGRTETITPSDGQAAGRPARPGRRDGALDPKTPQACCRRTARQGPRLPPTAGIPG